MQRLKPLQPLRFRQPCINCVHPSLDVPTLTPSGSTIIGSGNITCGVLSASSSNITWFLMDSCLSFTIELPKSELTIVRTITNVYSTLTLRDPLLCYDGATLTCEIANNVISTFSLQFRSEFTLVSIQHRGTYS